MTPRPLPILIADDDEEDRELTRRALTESRLVNEIEFVTDGEEVMQRLLAKDKPRPALILLDLKMPKMDGFDVLREVRANPDLRRIPIVALTTSSADADIVRTYELGVNSFIMKPVSFAGLVEAMNTLNRYWFELVELPVREGT